MAFTNFIKNQAARPIILAVLFVLRASAQDADFNWSWEEGKDSAVKPPVDSSVDAPPSKPPAANDDFKWSWDGSGAPPPSVPEGGKRTDTVEQKGHIRDDEAYQKLLTENLDLRRKIGEAMKDEELARNENKKLSDEIKAMEQNLSDSVMMIKSLKSAQGSGMSPEQINELEVKLAKTEKAKEDMAAELDRLKRLRDGEKQEMQSATAAVARGSDLFQDSEKENDLLKKRLAEIESERRRLEVAAAQAKKDADTAQQEAAKARTALEKVNEKAVAAARQGAEYKKIVEKLPAIEEQVNLLKTDVAMKDEKLSVRDEQLAALTMELDRREYRIAKAQKMADLLEKARSEIQQANNKEKLDMHYNMAVIYSKEERPRDAESEYLKALRIDPTDADIHYNLGILYDQSLKDAQKAIVHYRRYITLRPNAGDADQVRSWILDLELAH